MSKALPSIGSYGIFVLISPFTIADNINYLCTKINLISSLVNNNIDVYNLIYAPNKLTKDQYNADIAANASIVTLESTDGPTIDVPSTYVDTMPIVPAVPYSRLVLSIDLGELPDTLVLDQLLVDLQTVANNYVGVSSIPQLHKITGSSVSYEDYLANEIIRKAKVAEYYSFYTGKVVSDQSLADAKTRISMLETIIINQQKLIKSQ